MAGKSTKLHRHIGWAVILTEVSHVFCCVLPTIVTLISVLASMGVAIQVPVLMLDLHDFLHHYEVGIIMLSGVMLAVGWALYMFSRRIECMKSHCEPHETVCAPQKNNTHTVLVVASVVFLINVSVYTFVHVHLAEQMHQAAVTAHHDGHDNHHGHDH